MSDFESKPKRKRKAKPKRQPSRMRAFAVGFILLMLMSFVVMVLTGGDDEDRSGDGVKPRLQTQAAQIYATGTVHAEHYLATREFLLSGAAATMEARVGTGASSSHATDSAASVQANLIHILDMTATQSAENFRERTGNDASESVQSETGN